MAEVQIGKWTVLVDDQDLPLMSRYTWHIIRSSSGNHYVQRNRSRREPKNATISLHRVILGLTTGDPEVDHINRNGLDNQRSNLRLTTRSRNTHNKSKQTGVSSRFKGVSWFTRCNGWHAGLVADRVKHHFGYFDSEEDAARAYDAGALKYLGDYAVTNVSLGLLPPSDDPSPSPRPRRKAPRRPVKLTDADVRVIRSDFAAGVDAYTLASRFGVTRNTIWGVTSGRRCGGVL